MILLYSIKPTPTPPTILALVWKTNAERSLLGRGLYALQLQPWLEAFGREQIKVYFLEEVVEVRGR